MAPQVKCLQQPGSGLSNISDAAVDSRHDSACVGLDSRFDQQPETGAEIVAAAVVRCSRLGVLVHFGTDPVTAILKVNQVASIRERGANRAGEATGPRSKAGFSTYPIIGGVTLLADDLALIHR